MEQLSDLVGIIIPGGESTAICRVLDESEGFREELRKKIENSEIAVWGTCAGLILLAKRLTQGDPQVKPACIL